MRLLADINSRVPTRGCAPKKPVIHQRIEERVTHARIQAPQSLILWLRQLKTVHVIIPFTPIVPDQYINTATWEQIDRQVRQSSQHRLRRLTAKATAAGIHASGLILDRYPAQQIVKAARSGGMDLLIVGTHGRTGLTKFIVGSVAARVVATAPCPVVTV